MGGRNVTAVLKDIEERNAQGMIGQKILEKRREKALAKTADTSPEQQKLVAGTTKKSLGKAKK